MIIEKNELASKLKKLKGILTGKMRANAGVLVQGNSLYASNNEVGIKANLSVENTDRDFVIPLKAIELIENLPSAPIKITEKDLIVHIECGSIKNKYRTVAADEYIKQTPADKDNNNVTIDSAEIQDALNSVLYAVSDTVKKESLRGILLDAHDGVLNIVGCDGYRVAWNRIKYDGTFKVIVPRSTIQKVLSVGITGDISFGWDDKSIAFRSEEFEIVSRVISGEYIDYGKMFVKYDNETIIDRKSVAECIKRALICVEDKNSGLNAIRCNFEEKSLSVSLKQSLSEYEETVALEMPVSAPLEIGFNGRYLADALNSFMSDKLSVGLGGPNQHIVIDDGDQIAVVLPVKLNG